MSHHKSPLLSLRQKLPLCRGPVCIRLLRPDDLHHFFNYRSDPVVGEYQSWSAMTESEAHAFLTEMSALDDQWSIGEWIQLGIALSETGELIGDLGLLREDTQTAQIGITLARTAQGRGFATISVSEIRKILFNSGFNLLRAIIETRNMPSINLFSRLNFIEKNRHIYDIEKNYQELVM